MGSKKSRWISQRKQQQPIITALRGMARGLGFISSIPPILISAHFMKWRRSRSMKPCRVIIFSSLWRRSYRSRISENMAVSRPLPRAGVYIRSVLDWMSAFMPRPIRISGGSLMRCGEPAALLSIRACILKAGAASKRLIIWRLIQDYR